MIDPESTPRPIYWPNNENFVLPQWVKDRRSPFVRTLDRQIVVTGRPEDINAVIGALARRKIAVGNGQSVTISLDAPNHRPKAMHLSDLFSENMEHPMLQRFNGLEVRLCDIEGDESEAAVWAAIAAVFEEAANQGRIVFADPNLILGNPASGGSGGVSGGPLGNTGKLNDRHREPGEAYLNHWAFGAPNSRKKFGGRGINLEKNGARQVSHSGSETRVFILDTFPADVSLSSQTETNRAGKAGIGQFRRHLPKDDSLSADVNLCMEVSCLPQAVTINNTYLKDSPLKNHGIFVAGLVNRVAPEVELHLVQILDNFGQGEVFTLTGVLCLLASYALQNPVEDALPLSNVVVNLSLSANFSEEKFVELGVRESINKIWDQVKDSYDSQDVMQVLLSDMVNGFNYIPCVRLGIKILTGLGAVVVASAGNDSASVYGHLPMGIPARYKEVIGVAASNHNGELANFSNQGLVMAPGGGADDTESTITDINEIAAPGDDLSIYGMISLVPPTDPQDSGLAFWWGTSFSAPLVSGLAALVQEKYRQVYGKGPQPAEVSQLILRNAQQNVIDVQATLDAIQPEAPAV